MTTPLLSYASLLCRGIFSLRRTFPSLLKSCVALDLLPSALSLHQHAIVLGLAADAFIASSLVHMYASFGNIDNARRVFDAMPVKNVVPWSTIIAGYARGGEVDTAFGLCNTMRRQGMEPNSVTLLGLLSGVETLRRLECVHACVLRCGLQADLVLGNSLLNVYGEIGRVELAKMLLDEMHVKDVVSWNSLIAGYSHWVSSRGDSLTEGVHLFGRMRLEGIDPNQQTYVSLLFGITDIEAGKSIHGQVIVSGFEIDAHVETALIGMYLRFGISTDAFLLFKQTSDRDVVLWIAMISGLVQNDAPHDAVNVFRQMLMSGTMPISATIASVLAACAQVGWRNVGASIHGFIVRRSMELDIPAWNSLITMYAKCGDCLNQLHYVFEMMPDRDLVSWNAAISGYSQNGDIASAFSLFGRMRLSLYRTSADSITMMLLLQACSHWGSLHHGMAIHSLTIKHGLDPNVSVGTSLVDMYSKGGDLESAQRCFDAMPEKDVVSWGAIIGAYGSHGRGEFALRMYSDFLCTGMAPNTIVFLAVLSACNHTGHVAQGLQIFESMREDFDIQPKLEHCACIIDMLSKAGRVEEAFGFIRTMSLQPNADVLGILLDACRVHGYTRLGEEIAAEIDPMMPDSAGRFMQLAHSYAAMNRWDGVGETWARIRALGLKKAPGWSFLELNGSITVFFADHSSHYQYREMIVLLRLLDVEMRRINEQSLEIALVQNQ